MYCYQDVSTGEYKRAIRYDTMLREGMLPEAVVPDSSENCRGVINMSHQKHLSDNVK